MPLARWPIILALKSVDSGQQPFGGINFANERICPGVDGCASKLRPAAESDNYQIGSNVS
jgi:hypothetical protein